VWHAGPASLAARRSSAQACHLGRQTGLIDEDETGGIEVELAVEPGLPALQDVGTLLLQCVCGLFLNDQPRPRSQSLNVLRPMRMDRSDRSRSTISSSVMSRHSSIIPTMKSAWPSSRDPRRRPCGLGAVSPSRALPIQRIALDTPTPNRAAAWRADAPSAAALKTRDRKSSPNALAIEHLHRGER
jgi:hypothetical protein